MVDEMKVVRGCSVRGNECNVESDTCQKCNESNCNKGIFPKNRLNCFQCDTVENCKRDITENTFAKPCLNYVKDDKCYLYRDGSTSTKLGCQSDIENNPCTKDTANGQCRYCSDSNCNRRLFQEAMRIKCIQCSGNRTSNHDCFELSAGAFPAKVCEMDDVIGCYTKQEGDTITRGCCNKNMANSGLNCVACDGNNDAGCNNVADYFTCIRCRSDDNGNCKDMRQSIQGEKCRTGSGREEGCFSGIWSKYDSTQSSAEIIVILTISSREHSYSRLSD